MRLKAQFERSVELAFLKKKVVLSQISAVIYGQRRSLKSESDTKAEVAAAAFFLLLLLHRLFCFCCYFKHLANRNKVGSTIQLPPTEDFPSVPPTDTQML